jgi:ribosomal peptide maturation radical SAM protein 1
MSRGRTLRVCLVSPPLAEPSIPNLAIELLATLARRHGHTVKTLHGPLYQPRVFNGDAIHTLYAPIAFAPLYHGKTPEELSTQGARAVLADFGHLAGIAAEMCDGFADCMLFSMNDAAQCVERICCAIGDEHFDVIGFSVGFDSQKLPTACIARQLRAQGHAGVFVAGGTGCDGPMGQALLEFCPEIDLVVQGEAELALVDLLERVSKEEALDTVPGAVCRRSDGFTTEPERPFDKQFLYLDVPDYTSYFEQRARSRHVDGRRFVLFESSRGCWWGQRRHCTFCGIRNVDGPYRSRSAPETVAMIEKLQRRYEPDVLYATDAIADRANDNYLWPELARRRRSGAKWSIFYETKSDLTRRRAALMAAAGVECLQPGIESLSSNVLRRMHKGATGLQQVAMLKWSKTYNLTLHYSLMTRLPGETVEDINEVLTRIRRIHHLPPPNDVSVLSLHRFSPYFTNPAIFDLRAIRPFETQRALYQCDDEVLLRLCYQLNFDVDGMDTPELEKARQSLREAVHHWQEAHQLGARLTIFTLGSVRLVCRRIRDAVTLEAFDNSVEVHLLDNAQEVTRLNKLLGGCPAGISEARAALDRLVRAGLMLADDKAALCIAIPAAADAYADSGLDDYVARVEWASCGTRPADNEIASSKPALIAASNLHSVGFRK